MDLKLSDLDEFIISSLGSESFLYNNGSIYVCEGNQSHHFKW